MVEIQKISKSDYDQFSKSPVQSVFCTSKWLDLIIDSNQKIQYYSVQLDGVLRGTFPLCIQKNRILRSLSLPALTPHLGINYLNDQNDIKVRQEINSSVIDFISNFKTDSIYYAFNPSIKVEGIQKTSGLSMNLWKTYQINLNQSIEEIYKGLKTDKKRNLKNAEKEGLKVSFEKNPKILLDLVKMTYKRQGIEPIWIQKIDHVVSTFDKGFQVTVFNNANPISSIYLVTDDKNCYYLFGGYNEKANNYNAGPFGMWNAIVRAKEMGLEIFDFEGSEIPQIEKYFQRFGGKKVLYFSVEKTNWKQKLVKLLR